MVLLLTAVGGALWPGQTDPIDPDGLFARIHTAQGTITVVLEHERAPLATASFVGLAEGTIENAAFPPGQPYYDGTLFHRVVPGHVIQAGVPASDRASSPGYVFPNEVHAHLDHGREGVLGVANSGPHTNSAQFYITLGDRSYLDGDYIVFGEVVDGIDVVRSVVEGDRVDSVRVVRRGDAAESFRPTTASFRAMVERAEERVAEHELLRARAEEEWLAGNLPELDGTPDEVRTAPTDRAVCGPDTPDPGGPAPTAGQDRAAGPTTVRVCYRGIALRYRGDLLGHEGPVLSETPFASGPGGSPVPLDRGTVFEWEEGTGSTPAGLDEVMSGLAPGARILAVVPPALGYGTGGHYAPERPGEPRFVLSPNSMLVYEVEILPTRR